MSANLNSNPNITTNACAEHGGPVVKSAEEKKALAEEYAAAGLSRSQGEALRAQLVPAPAATVYRVVSQKEDDKSTSKSKSKNSSLSKSPGAKKGTGNLNKRIRG